MPNQSRYNVKDSLSVTVKSTDAEFAHVELEDGRMEDWHLDGLPRGLKVGDVLTVRAGEGHYEVRIQGK